MLKWLAAIVIVVLSCPALTDAQGRGGAPGRGGGGGAGRGAGPAPSEAPGGPVARHGVEVPGYRARLDNLIFSRRR